MTSNDTMGLSGREIFEEDDLYFCSDIIFLVSPALIVLKITWGNLVYHRSRTGSSRFLDMHSRTNRRRSVKCSSSPLEIAPSRTVIARSNHYTAVLIRMSPRRLTLKSRVYVKMITRLTRISLGFRTFIGQPHSDVRFLTSEQTSIANVQGCTSSQARYRVILSIYKHTSSMIRDYGLKEMVFICW